MEKHYHNPFGQHSWSDHRDQNKESWTNGQLPWLLPIYFNSKYFTITFVKSPLILNIASVVNDFGCFTSTIWLDFVAFECWNESRSTFYKKKVEGNRLVLIFGKVSVASSMSSFSISAILKKLSDTTYDDSICEQCSRICAASHFLIIFPSDPQIWDCSSAFHTYVYPS